MSKAENPCSYCKHCNNVLCKTSDCRNYIDFTPQPNTPQKILETVEKSQKNRVVA